MAKRLAQRVPTEGKVITFDPMNARERSIVHWRFAMSKACVPRAWGKSRSVGCKSFRISLLSRDLADCASAIDGTVERRVLHPTEWPNAGVAWERKPGPRRVVAPDRHEKLRDGAYPARGVLEIRCIDDKDMPPEGGIHGGRTLGASAIA